MTDNELWHRLAATLAATFNTRLAELSTKHGLPDDGRLTPADFAWEVNAVLPLVRAEIAAAEQRGAERAAQAIDDVAPGDGWQAEVFCDLGRIAREAVPAPTGDNA